MEALPRFHFIFIAMPRVKLFDEAEILTKAMNLFWKKGYAATSIQDLVNHLGINRASLYDTYGGKEQLFKSAFELYRKNNLDQLRTFFDSKPNVKQGFSDLFANTIDGAVCDIDKKGCFAVNTATELIPNDESIRKILEKNKNDFETLFYDYLKKGQDQGQLKSKTDLKSLASLLYMIYSGIQVVSKIQADKKELSNSIKTALMLLQEP